MAYEDMTREEFDTLLAEIVEENAGSLLTVPGAYEVFSEHFNNEVLDRWEAERRNELPLNKNEIPVEDEQLAGVCEHEPDWEKIQMESDGGEWYIHVPCRLCGEIGVIGTRRQEDNITWED